MSGRFTIGPFDLELITLTHSIPEPNAVVIRTSAGTVLHTGDWKLDPDPLIGEADRRGAAARGRRRGGAGDRLRFDQRAEATGHSGSEGELRQSLTELIGRYDGRVAVACFASNVARLSTIAHAARANDRDVALVGRSLWRIDKAARENGYLADVPRFLTEDEAGYVPRDKIVLICTGSQGEPRAALARIARDDHPNIVLEEGDVVIFSSRIIPGNEKAIGRLHNALMRLGVEVVTDEDHFVHVSGHPYRDELVRDVPDGAAAGRDPGARRGAPPARPCRPRAAMPGAAGRWSSRTATWCGSTAAAATIVDEVPVGRIASDGKSLLPIGGAVLQQRRRVGSDGSVVATLVVDRARRARGAAAGQPDRPRRSQRRAGGRRCATRWPTRSESLPAPLRHDDDALREAARRVLRRRAQRALRQAAADRNPASGDGFVDRQPSRDGIRAMIGRLNHVAIVVPDLAAAAALYRDVLGARVSAPHPLPAHGVTVVFVELPNTQDRTAASRSAPGRRCAAFSTRTRPAACTMSATRSTTSSPRATGCAPPAPACSATASRKLGAHDKPVLFLHPKDFCGTLIELEQA